MNDALSDDDFIAIAGERPSKSAVAKRKVMDVLDSAGILYWIKADGSIGTTWHHVHNCKPAPSRPELPNLSAIK